MSQFLKSGKIPKGRLLFWVLTAMAGVGYVLQPDSKTQRYLVWGSILSTGVVFAGFGLVLNWTQTERARAWVREHPRLVGTLFVVSVLGSALLKFLDKIRHKP